MKNSTDGPATKSGDGKRARRRPPAEGITQSTDDPIVNFAKELGTLIGRQIADEDKARRQPQAAQKK